MTASRARFLAADLMVSIVASALVALLVGILIAPGWPIWMAMPLGMAVGMALSIPLLLVVGPLLGMIEPMLQIMPAAMLAGMAASMAIMRDPFVGIGTLAVLGAGCGACCGLACSRRGLVAAKGIVSCPGLIGRSGIAPRRRTRAWRLARPNGAGPNSSAIFSPGCKGGCCSSLQARDSTSSSSRAGGGSWLWDVSERMLHRARSRAASYDGLIELHQMDVGQLAFADDCFDRIYTSCTFCSVSDPLRGLRELRRVLRPGGSLHMFEHTGSRWFPFNLMLTACTPLSRVFGPEMNRLPSTRCAGRSSTCVESSTTTWTY